MTREDINKMLAAIERAQTDRTEIWRVVITGDGREVGRVFRGTFVNKPPQHKG